MEWIEAVAANVKRAEVATLLIPGIEAVHDLKEAYSDGRVSFGCPRIAEADVSK